MIAGIGIALSKFGDWVAGNKAVQWALGALLFIVALILWGERREAQGRDRQKLKQDRQKLKDEQAAREKTEQLKQEAAHEAEQAIKARDSAGGIDSRSMSDADFYRHFGYHRTPREVGD